MKRYDYDYISSCLRIGRELEFSFRGGHYSVTNSGGRWNFCIGTTLLEELCPFRELEYLARRVGELELDGVTVRRIFDEGLYEPGSLWIG